MLIVFDVMGTLLADPYAAAHEAACGMPVAEITRRTPPGLYHQLERGEIDEAGYWAGLRGGGAPGDPDVFHRVRRAGYAWLDGMPALAADCAAAHPTVAGSNYPSWMDDVTADHLAALDLRVFVSWRLGVRKPDPRFFMALCAATGAAPEDLVLIDDKVRNVDAVTSLGGAGVHHVSAARTRRSLRDLGVLPG